MTKGDQYDVRERGEVDDDTGGGGGDGDASTTTSTTTTGGGRRRGGAQPKPVRLASRYYDEGADEVAFLNMITSHSSQKSHFLSFLRIIIDLCMHPS